MDDSKKRSTYDEVEKGPHYGDDTKQEEKQGLVYHDEPYRSKGYEEEYAQELAMSPNETIKSEEQETEMQTEVKTGMGWLALVIAGLSLFIAPILLGGAGIVLGFISRRRGAETLGNTAIFIGAASILLSLFFTAF
ncbi:hypothetical protein SAMN05421743_111133 [Thalassobacillus cyri]|uniref:DUF4190 domain-containing protein n=1 Tax=Thalassobacillus cyri TaxID=571932 RepID=A0A1H4FJ14_9BACI|nr:hypothetical protein [Thalassobacillus cyri]SEA97047.1 hypothetical protein SAMN05421743_111133 [Thalassobacillus cyri]